MSAIATRTFTQCFDDARSVMFLNDSGKSLYTDAVLLPVGAFVHAEIQDEWAKRGIPILETIKADMAYTAGDSSIPIPSAITATFQAPLEIWEQPADGSGIWQPMTRVDRIPPPLPTNLAYLGIWEWRDGAIIVLPCSNNRTIWCRYRIQVAYPGASDTMGSEGFYWALVAGTAFYAAIGSERATVRSVAGPVYQKRTMDAIQIASRDRQVISFQQQSTNSEDGFLAGWRGPVAP